MVRKTIYLAVLGTLVIWPLAAAVAGPAFDGTAENVWVLDDNGALRGSYGLGNGSWSTTAAAGPGSQATVTTVVPPGTTVIPHTITLGPSDAGVLINSVQASLPPPAATLPPVTLAGLTPPVLTTTAEPGVAVSPPPGTYGQTVAVRFTAFPAPSLAGEANMRWRINGGAFFCTAPTDGSDTCTVMAPVVFLDLEGRYVVEYQVGQNGTDYALRQVVYTISGPAAGAQREAWLHRDSDGDFLPDRFEVANGLDPLVDSARLDSDGDGWTDFEELIRSSDNQDEASVPVDSDGDGWSDFDEDLRGTNPNDPLLVDADQDGTADSNPYPDKPVARRRYEPEYLLSGKIFADPGESVGRTDISLLTVLDVRWVSLFSTGQLVDATTLAGQGLTGNQIPDRYRLDLAQGALALGTLPILRLPAGQAMILRAQAAEPAAAWVVKSWLNGLPDVDPAGMEAWLQGENRSWDTAAAWQQAYVDYLRAKLVVARNELALSPASGVPIALLEGLLHWYGDLPDGTLALLGNPLSPSVVLGLHRLLADIAPRGDSGGLAQGSHGQTLDELFAALVGLCEPSGPLWPFAATIHGYYTDLNGLPETSTSRAASALALNQLAESPDSAAGLALYLARLLAVVEPDVLSGLTPAAYGRLTDPLADYDLDGLQNSRELAALPWRITRPDRFDTDGDGQGDRVDPCPLNAGNTCGIGLDDNGDLDGDGVVNGLDNCIRISNPAQIDLNGDGIGDACQDDWDGDGYSNTQEQLAGSDPANFASTPVASTLALRQGYNLVAFPADPLTYGTLYGVMAALGGSATVDRIEMYDNALQRYVVAGFDGNGFPYGEDRHFGAGGPPLSMAVEARQDRAGIVLDSTYCPAWELRAGVNLLGSPCLTGTAYQLMQRLGGPESVISVQGFDPATGKFVTAAYLSDGTAVGVDFALQAGQAVYISMRTPILQFQP